MNHHTMAYLHVADSNTVVSAISNNFILDFFPAFHAFPILRQSHETGAEQTDTSQLLKPLEVISFSSAAYSKA